MLLSISLFGPFRCSIDGEPFAIKSRRGRAMLAVLLLSDGQSIARDRLAELLWPDRAQPQARASLRQELTTLRNAMGPAAACLQSDTERLWIEQTPDVSISADATDLQSGLIEGAEFGGFLDGLEINSADFESWRAETGRDLDRRRVRCLEEKIAAAKASSNAQAVEALARRVIAIDPWSEGTLGILMEALAELGRSAEALAEYSEYEARLLEELAAKPGAKLTAVRNTIAGGGAASQSQSDELFRRPAILLLPIEVHSENPEDGFIARGVADDLRTTLAYWRWFPVIGPEAIDPNAGRDVPSMTASVGARYALSVTLRRSGPRVRLSASLIDATGRTLWSENFNGTLDDIFAFQEETSRSVVGRLEPEISRAEAQRIARSAVGNRRAWQLVAQADEIERNGGPGYGTIASNLEQLPLLDEALDLEPDYARALSRIAKANFRLSVIGPPEERAMRMANVDDVTRRALDIDPNEWEAHVFRGLWATLGQRDHATGNLHGLEAARLNPCSPVAHHGAACVLGWAGDLEPALYHLDIITRLNPRYSARAVTVIDAALAHFFLGRPDKAASCAREMIAIAPQFSRGLERTVAIFGAMGEADMASEMLARVMHHQPNFSLEYVRRTYPFARSEHMEAFVAGLEAASVPAT